MTEDKPDRNELAEKEKKLKVREEALKQEKRKALEEKEKKLEYQKIKDTVKQERAITRGEVAEDEVDKDFGDDDDLEDDDELEDDDVDDDELEETSDSTLPKQDNTRGSPDPPHPPDIGLSELQSERMRIQKRISEVESRFHDGGIDDTDFRTLLDVYKNMLVEADVGIKKLKEEGRSNP